MIRAALVLPAALIAAVPAGAEPVAVPSGRAVEHVETIHEPDGPMGPVWRFRFVAPGIDRTAAEGGVAAIAADMDHLCGVYAIPRLPAAVPAAARIVISLAAAPVAFGDARPEIAQFFEAYSVAGGSCIWEGL